MAVCEIWDVKGRLDHPIDYAKNPEKTVNPKYTEADLQALGDVMKYATNGEKTEKQFFVTGVNCDPATARDEMMITKGQWQDESEIVCYHGYQSFKQGEVTPEQAHEVGVKLAERMWGDRFQVIVATHLNTDCLHNHFVLNSVSFADGKHYHDNKKNLRLLRKRSDELCREYALSVIEQPSGRKKPYALYQAEKQGLPTRDTVARQAVDEAISKSFTLKDFDRELLKMGYRINFDPNRKYWTIIGKGWQRPKRLYKLGEDYTNDRIVERIKENSYAVRFSQFAKSTKEVKVFRVRGTMKNARKIGGLRGLYLHYCYKLGILPKGRKQDYAKLHYLLKDDLMKMEMIAKETRLLCRCHIDTAEQLLSYQASLTTEMAELTAKRKGLYSLSRKASGEEKEAVKAQISEITGRLNTIRKEVRLCEGIEVRSGVLKEKSQTIRTEEQETKRKELMKNEHRRRSGRTDRPNELGGL
ncbi:relaxase/mobilization nuclease domain-containing protein [Mediterraneibacter gnavus]|uniref:relaxase/mobilization nuclease domain-containing protein n=1 Tax=Mediterraneibacter gnavus TaxID=33038 RepID=UPI000C7D83C9|nr:relaxase [Mediterraneibacter gnavus]